MAVVPYAIESAPVEVAGRQRVTDPRGRSFWRRGTMVRRLWLMFPLLGVISLAMSALGGWQVMQVHAFGMANLRLERMAGELYGQASADAARAAALARATDAGLRAALEEELAAGERRATELQQALAQAIGAGPAQALAREAGERRDAFRAGWQPAAGEAWREAAHALLRFQGGEGAGEAAAGAHARRASWVMLLATLGVALVFTPIVWLFSDHIIRPLLVATRVARKVADGDLTMKVRTGGTDELAQLMLALDDMTENLRRIVGEVMRGAHVAASTGGQVLQGNADLAQRTEEQASTLEETASAMEQLTAAVARNADTAAQASRLALGAAEVAQKGGEVVGQVVGSMAGISASARKISEISGLIDGIAFQTNILALNAAVEAARAGEQGRGFAVVASEVRSLAQRSAAAAKEIKQLIGDSVEKVDSGARLADAAGRTMEDIVATARQVSDLIAAIAAAGEEQRGGIEQVNTGVARMEQVVQKNVALVEQTRAASAALNAQSGALVAAVAQFRLEDGAQAQPSRPRTAGAGAGAT